jgi:hypothetical protein
MGLAAAKVTYAQHRRVNVRFLGCNSPLIRPSRVSSFFTFRRLFRRVKFFPACRFGSADYEPFTGLRRLAGCAVFLSQRKIVRGGQRPDPARSTESTKEIWQRPMGRDGSGTIRQSLLAEPAATLRNAAGATCLRAGSSGAKAALPRKMKVPNSSPVESEHALCFSLRNRNSAANRGPPADQVRGMLRRNDAANDA